MSEKLEGATKRVRASIGERGAIRVLGVPIGLGIAVLGALLIFTSGTADPIRVSEALTLDPGGTCDATECDVVLDNVPPSVTGGTDHDFCAAGEEDQWHFIINGLGNGPDGQDAPASITVTFTNAGSVVIPLEGDVDDGAAHYRLSGQHLTDTLTGGKASIQPGEEDADEWSGNFVLSHAPCLDVTSTPTATPTNTTVPPTSTPTATPTNTPPVATSTQQVESTSTPTATPTNTTVPSTSTPTATSTSTPDPTITPSATNTPPIATSTQQVEASSTPTRTPTNTPVTQVTNTPAPTSTVRPPSTPAPTNTSVPLVAQVQSVQATPPPAVRALPSTGNGGYSDNSMNLIFGLAMILAGSTITLAAMKRRAQ